MAQSNSNSKPGFVLTAYGWRTAAEAGVLEYEAEKEAVLERVNKRSPNQLVADGTGIVGLGAEFDRNSGRITLYWEWGAVPYLSEISRGRTVLISTVDGGVDVEDASKTISGEVCSAILGERLALLNSDEFDAKSAKALKQLLASRLGISRFRQRLLVEDCSRAIPDDEVLIASVASDPLKIQLVLLEYEQAEGDTAVDQMCYACDGNHADALEDLLQRPTNPNLKDCSGSAPLHYAAGNGHLELVQLLLEANANKDAGSKGCTPLYIASKNCYVDVVRILIEAGVDQNKATTAKPDPGSSPLFIASSYGHVEVVRALLTAGADQNQATTDMGISPLFIASGSGHLEVVRTLIEAGADQNQATTVYATSPLQIASQQGHLDVVRFLIAAGSERRVESISSECIMVVTQYERLPAAARLRAEM
eukprot:Skav209636  [mRNA]  locus=scaffold2751:88952:96923:+ [translate_table: standard]